MATTVLSIPTISCGHCQATITEALTPLDGVRSVIVDIPAKKATVEYDPAVVGVDKMKEILAEEDYPVESAGAHRDPYSRPRRPSRPYWVGRARTPRRPIAKGGHEPCRS